MSLCGRTRWRFLDRFLKGGGGEGVLGAPSTAFPDEVGFESRTGQVSV